MGRGNRGQSYYVRDRRPLVLANVVWETLERGDEAFPHRPRPSGSSIGLAFVFSFIGAAALAMLLPVDATFSDGIKLGALVGACFVATSFGVNYQFSNRPWIALLIDGGFHIVQFSVMGAILGAWHP